MFGYMMIANLLATLFAYKEPELALWIFIGCNIFFTIFVICGYVLFATARLKLTENEVEAKDMAKEKKKTILKGIGLGSYFAIAIHLLNGLLSMMLDEEDFLPYIVSPDRIVASLLGGCFFGGMMYLVLRLRLKKVEE
jgi:succinate dehydrogenase/fumarate reductase cytochrome b subunit